MTICIEAKADESFGGTVAKELKKARDRVAAKKQSETRFPERLDWLTRSVLGVPAFEDDKLIEVSTVVAELPYQLLSAIGGTLLEADRQNTCKAVFIVHEFRTVKTKDANLDANANALNRFLRIFLSANKVGVSETIELECGKIIGPIHITDRAIVGPIRIPYHIPLFIGKIRTDMLA